MNMLELRHRLERDGYDQRWYSFDREAPPLEGFILEKVGERWIVFYTERGEIRDIANFENEFDACDYFYEKMQKAFGSTVGRAKH
jgi:hypothetical protein